MLQSPKAFAQYWLWALVVVIPVLVLVWRYAINEERKVARTKATRAELAGLTPEQFERWCAKLLEAQGYRVRRAGGSGDHGIDLIAERGSDKVVVQCKRNTGRRTISESVVRDLYGAMHDQQASSALLMSAGKITAAATAWAQGKPIELWDLQRLARLGVETQGEAGTGGAAPTEASTTERCPSCGRALVTRRRRSDGAPFVGCTGFPSCRYTRDVPASTVSTTD